MYYDINVFNVLWYKVKVNIVKDEHEHLHLIIL